MRRGRESPDPLLHEAKYAYDTYGLLKAVVVDAVGSTEYDYDSMSRLISIKDAKRHSTAFDYDSMGRVRRTTYQDGKFETATYDGDGQVKTRKDRKGVHTTFVYDDARRLWKKTYSDGSPDVTFDYDAAWRLKTAGNGTDAVSRVYDLAGQLRSETSTKNASTVEYQYDLAGHRGTLKLSGAQFLGYVYDDDSLLFTISRGTSVFTFGYDEAHRRKSLTYPPASGIVATYAYDDPLSHLKSLTVQKGAAIVARSAYTYDDDGKRKTKATPELVETYGYDKVDRLTGVERTGLPRRWVYRYDAVGNRQTSQVDASVSTVSYNEVNQLGVQTGVGSLLWRGTLDEAGTVKLSSATVNGQPARMLPGNAFEATLDATVGDNMVTVQAMDASGNNNTRTNTYKVTVSGAGANYSYDPNGNLTSKTENGSTWSYEWNAESQLTRVTKDGAEVARFAYDPMGRRVEKTAGGVTTSFAYDGQDILRRTSGASITRLVHGAGIDQPLAIEQGSTVSYLHADALGSVIKTTNAAGTTLSSIRYDAWGNIEQGSPDLYGFTGREPDLETGLAYYRARYYDPKIGRFLGEDPLGWYAGINLYRYVRDSPTTMRDPFGLQAVVHDPRLDDPEIRKCICTLFNAAGGTPGSGERIAWVISQDGQPSVPTCVRQRALVKLECRAGRWKDLGGDYPQDGRGTDDRGRAGAEGRRAKRGAPERRIFHGRARGLAHPAERAA